MHTVVFLDLDDSVFQTQPKCPPGEPVRPAAFRRDGTPLSFMTDRQRTLLELLSRESTIIPTTARNLDAYRRVDLPFSHAAILDFGGVVLQPGGALDRDWDSVIRPQARAFGDELYALHREIVAFIGDQQLGANARVICDYEMPLYVVIKHPAADTAKLVPIREKFAQRPGFFVHFNDNNLSFVPKFLGKEHGVRHVLQRYFADAPVLTLGLGDSLSDAPFLALCDFALLPRGSQLARQHLDRACSAGATTPTM